MTAALAIPADLIVCARDASARLLPRICARRSLIADGKHLPEGTERYRIQADLMIGRCRGCEAGQRRVEAGDHRAKPLQLRLPLLALVGPAVPEPVLLVVEAMRAPARPIVRTAPPPLCRGCGQPFKRRDRSDRYCGPECVRLARNARHLARKRARFGTTYAVHCQLPGCGRVTEAHKHQGRRLRYCIDRDCSYQAELLRSRDIRRAQREAAGAIVRPGGRSATPGLLEARSAHV